MRLLFVGLALGLLGLVQASPGPAQTPFRPVATVNKSIISGFDLEQRMRLLQTLGAPADSPQQLQQIALDRLIDDRLRMQAAEAAGIEATDDMMAEGMAAFAGQLGVTVDALAARFRDAGITEQAVRDMIVSQIVWREVVQTRFAGRVEPAESDIDAEVALAGQGEMQFRLLEIGLPYTADGRTEAETRDLADRIYVELAAGGDFGAAVARYSRAPSAGRGGDVGWVPADAIPASMAARFASAEIGEVLPPRAVQGGVTILKLVDRQQGGAVVADAGARERVRNEMMVERMELLAQGYIQELRREALIEVR